MSSNIFFFFCLSQTNWQQYIYKIYNEEEKRQYHIADDKNSSEIWGCGTVNNFKWELLHLWQPPGKQKGCTDSSTSWLSVKLLAVQFCAKTGTFNQSSLAGWLSRTRNFEAPRMLNGASAHVPLFRFFEGSTQVTGTGSTNWRSTNRDVLIRPFLDYLAGSHTRTRCRLFWIWPAATYRMPLFLWILDCHPTIHGPIDTGTNLGQHLRARRGLHVAPWFIHSTGDNAVRNCRPLSQHGDTEVGKEAPLIKVRVPHEILQPKPGTTHFIFDNHYTVLTDDELLREVTGPRIIRAVSWNTCKKYKSIRTQNMKNFNPLVTIHILNRCWWARKLTCKEQNDKTSPRSGRLLIHDRSSCRCSCAKDWYSARPASISLPLTHPISRSPSRSKPNRWKGAWLSPPVMIAGQKQLIPCPMLDRAATFDSAEFVNSSRNFRVSWWNFPRKN